MDKWFEDLQAELGVEKVDKCGLCLLQVSLGYYGKARIDEPFCVVGIEPQDCHLTPDHQRLIELMIGGESYIHSSHRPGISEKNPDSGLPWHEAEIWTVITRWQERKEGE